MPRTFFDIRSREMIRSKLSWYRYEHQIGLPTLALRVEACHRDGTEISVKTLQRFMKGIRVDDSFVALIKVFSDTLPTPTVPALPAALLQTAFDDMQIELAINDRAEAIVFHSRPFAFGLSWLEFDLNSQTLGFVMHHGTVRDHGIAVRPELCKYMKRAKRALIVLLPEADVEPEEAGYYVPLQAYRNNPRHPSIALTKRRAAWPPAISLPLSKEHNGWNVVQGVDLESLLRKVHADLKQQETSFGTTQAVWQPLSFYESFVLVKVWNTLWTDSRLRLYYLTAGGYLFRLKGDAGVIHGVNSIAPAQITEANVTHYLKFFCFFAGGNEGPYLLIETSDDLSLFDTIDQKTRCLVESSMYPVSYKGRNQQGQFLCEGVVFNSNDLFIAHFAVQPDGQVEMLKDFPLAEGLPVRLNLSIM